MTGPVQERPLRWARQEQADRAGSGGGEPQVDLGKVTRAARRQLPLVAVFATLGAVIAALMILGSVPRYRAVETVLLDEERADLLNEVSPLPNAARSDSAVQSEIEIIKSLALAYEVVDRLDLGADEIFLSPPVGATTEVMADVMALTDPLAEFLTPEEPAAAPPPGNGAQLSQEADLDQNARDRAARLLRSRLSVSRVGRSFVIQIGYEGYDPVRAAAIARAYGSAYETFQLEATSQVAANAGEWIQDRLEVLERQSLDAAAAVQEFRAENNLVQVRGNLLTEQQQSELASELVSAAAATAQAEARLENLEALLERAETGEDVITVPVSEGGSLVQELRRQYLDARIRQARLIEEFGADHPQARELGSEMADLAQAIRAELAQAAEAARAEFNVAGSREQSLREELESATDTTDRGVAVLGRLRQLEAISETYAQVYQDYLQRYEVTTQQQGFPIASVKVISAADVPKGATSPQKKMMLATGLFLGALIGISIGALRELRRQPMRTASDVGETLGLPCAGLLPRISWFGSNRKATRTRERTLQRVRQACEENARTDGGTIVGLAPLCPGDDGRMLIPSLADLLTRNRTRDVLVLDGGGASRPLYRRLSELERVEIADLGAASGQHVTYDVPDESGFDEEALVQELRRNYAFVLLLMPPLSEAAEADPLVWAYDIGVLRLPWGRVLPAFVSGALHDHRAFHTRLVTSVLENARLRSARMYMSPGSYEERVTYA